MLIQARIVRFDWEQYLVARRSFGFAVSSAVAGGIFVGTDWQVEPEIADTVILGPRGQMVSPAPLTSAEVAPDAIIMISIMEGKKGLCGRWCTLARWEQEKAKLALNLETQQAATGAERARLAQMELLAKTNPRSLSEAFSHGWTIHSHVGRQVVVHLRVGEKTLSKTFCVALNYQPPTPTAPRQRQFVGV